MLGEWEGAGKRERVEREAPGRERKEGDRVANSQLRHVSKELVLLNQEASVHFRPIGNV